MEADHHQKEIEAVVDNIIHIHDVQLAKFGGGSGLRDRNLLLSAVGRVKQAIDLFGEDQFSTFDAIGMLGHSIMKNHAFVDGNKRTAFAMMDSMAAEAGYEFALTDKEIEDAIVDFASSSGGFEEISEWLEENLVLRDGYMPSSITPEGAGGTTL